MKNIVVKGKLYWLTEDQYKVVTDMFNQFKSEYNPFGINEHPGIQWDEILGHIESVGKYMGIVDVYN